MSSNEGTVMVIIMGEKSIKEHAQLISWKFCREGQHLS